MKTKLIILALFINSCNTVSKDPGHSETDFGKLIGFMHHNCLAIENDSLGKGQTVYILEAYEKDQVVKVKIEGRISDDNHACVILQQERDVENKQDGVSFYTLDLLGNETVLSPSIAVVNEVFSLQRENEEVSADIDSDGSTEFFNTCNTSEGIYFSIWSDIPWKSKELWSAYYYLGYDMEPNCPEKD